MIQFLSLGLLSGVLCWSLVQPETANRTDVQSFQSLLLRPFRPCCQALLRKPHDHTLLSNLHLARLGALHANQRFIYNPMVLGLKALIATT
jgi:hypothetical protein